MIIYVCMTGFVYLLVDRPHQPTAEAATSLIDWRQSMTCQGSTKPSQIGASLP